MKLLFVHPSVSDLSILKNSVLDDVDIHITREIDLNHIIFNMEHITHISFMFHTNVVFPFKVVDKERPIQRNGHPFFLSFVHFFKRIKERKNQEPNKNKRLYIDFLSCDFKIIHIVRLLGKRNILQYNDDIVLRVSTNDTGNKPYADWIMEYSTDLQNNINIRTVYFNDNIKQWNIILNSDTETLHVTTYNDFDIDLTDYKSIYFKSSNDPSLNNLGMSLFETKDDKIMNIESIYHEKLGEQEAGFYPGLITVNKQCFKNTTTLVQADFDFAENLFYIAQEAFFNTGIEIVNLKNTYNLKEISVYAFAECKKLTTVSLNSNIITLGKGIFKNCTNLTDISYGQVTNLSNVDLETIPQEFAFNTKINNFIIPPSILNINSYAFQNSGISNIEFYTSTDGNGISFGTSCFSETKKLKTFNFPKDRSHIELNTGVFSKSGLTTIQLTQNINKGLESDKQLLPTDIFKDCEDLKTCTFENYRTGSIRKIEIGSFSGCTSLLNFSIPQYIEQIGDVDSNIGVFTDDISGIGVFSGCSSLQNVNFMYSPTISVLGDFTFFKCSKLQVITLPSSIEALGKGCFSGCSSLVDIYLQNTKINNIPESCFSDCKSLTTIILNDDCDTIEKNAFGNCEKLYNITFGSQLKRIHENAFIGCTKLIDPDNNDISILMNNDKRIRNNIVVDAPNLDIIKDKNKWIYKTEYLLVNNDLTNPSYISDNHRKYINEIIFGSLNVQIPDGRFINYNSINVVVLPDYIDNIPTQCFMGSSIYDINIPNNVQIIEEEAFSGCTNLQFIRIDIENSKLKTIERRAFYQDNITIVELPNSLEYIGVEAFNGCKYLKQVLLPNNNILFQPVNNAKTNGVDTDAFLNGNTKCTYIFNLYDYEESIELYNLKTRANIFTVHEDAETYKNKPKFFFAKQFLYSGQIIDEENKEYVYDISFDNNVTFNTIPDNLCSNTNIDKIIIPDNITTIQKFAFYGCEYLQHVEIGKNTTIIQNDAFRRNNDECIYIIDNYSNNVSYLDNTFTNSNIFFKKKYFIYQFQLNEHADNENENIYLNEFNITDDISLYKSLMIFPDNALSNDGKNTIIQNEININSFQTYIINNNLDDNTNNSDGIILINVNDNYIYRYVNNNLYTKYNTQTDNTSITVSDIYDGIRCNLTIKSNTKIIKNLHIGYSTNIELNDITYIPENCFKNAINLQHVRIPKYKGLIIDDIRNDAFSGCTSVNTFIRDKPWNINDISMNTIRSYFTKTDITTTDVDTDTHIINYIFFSELEFNSDKNLSEYVNFNNYAENNKHVTSITISNNVTTIPDNIFKNLNIKNITLPNSITTIGKQIFENTNIRIVNIDQTIKEWNFVSGIENLQSESLNEGYIIIIKEDVYPIENYQKSFLPSSLYQHFVENILYEQYSDIAYPVLKSFKSVTWQQNGYTNIIETPLIIQILNGLFYTFYEHMFHIDEEIKTISLLDHIKLNTNANIENTYIYIPRNWTFNGNGYHIDINGINGWKGMFRCSEENPYHEYIFIKHIGIIGGHIEPNSGCGIILQSNMNFVSIQNTFTTGDIEETCGGIIGTNCSNIEISECFSRGSIKNNAGGIVAYDTSGNIKIHSCYSSGDIYSNGCGIIAKTNRQTSHIEIHDCFSTGLLLSSDSYGIYHMDNVIGYNFSIEKCYSKIGVFEIYNNISNIDFYTYARNTNFDISYGKFGQYEEQKYPILNSFTNFPYTNTLYDKFPNTFYDAFLFGTLKLFYNDFYFSMNKKTIYLENDIFIDKTIYTKDSYVYLQNGWKFQGNGHTIDISGIQDWTGLIRCDKRNDHIIENVAILNGKTDKYCGFILYKEQENVTLNKCYVENCIIGEFGGGLIGGFSGTFGNTISIQQCYFKGKLEQYSGGFIGSYSGRRGNIKISQSYVIIQENGISTFSGGLLGSHSGHYGNLSFETTYVLEINNNSNKIIDTFNFLGSYSDLHRVRYKDCFLPIETVSGVRNINDINIYLQQDDGIFEEITDEQAIDEELIEVEEPIVVSDIFDPIIFNIDIVDDVQNEIEETNNYYIEEAFPTLKCFNELPWSKEIEYHGIFNDYNPLYNNENDNENEIWFEPDTYNSKQINLIQNITLSDYIDFNTYTYKDTYILLSSGFILNGNNNTIDLSGIDTWKGFIKSTATPNNICKVKDIGFFNGRTYRGAGFILQAYQNNVEIDSCFSYGDIYDYGGGIIGQYCGVVFDHNNQVVVDTDISSVITIINSYTGGDIYNHSGGITGPYCCIGYCEMNIRNCFSSGSAIGIHSSGIIGKSCGNNYGKINIKGCIYYGSISGYNACGLVGYNVANYYGTCNIEYVYSLSFIANDLPKYIVNGPFNAMYEGTFHLDKFYFVDNIVNDYTNSYFVGNYLGKYDGTSDISNVLFLYTNELIEPENYLPEFSSFIMNHDIDISASVKYGITFMKQNNHDAIHDKLMVQSTNVNNSNNVYFKKDELNNPGFPLISSFTKLPWSTLEYHHYDTIPVFSVFKDLWISAYGSENSNNIINIDIGEYINNTDHELYIKIMNIINQVIDPESNEPLVVIKQMYDELFNIHFSNNPDDEQQYITILNSLLNIDLQIGDNIKEINIFNSFYLYDKDENSFIVHFNTILNGYNINDNVIPPLFYTYIQRGFSLNVKIDLELGDVYMITIERDMNGTDYILKYLEDLNEKDNYTTINTDITQLHNFYIKNNSSSLYHFNVYFKPIFIIEYLGIKTLNNINAQDASI